MIVRRCRGVFLALASRPQHHLNEETPEPAFVSKFEGPTSDEDKIHLNLGRTSHQHPVGQGLTSLKTYTRLKAMSSTQIIELSGISKEAAEKIVTLHCGFPVKTIQDKVFLIYIFSSNKLKL